MYHFYTFYMRDCADLCLNLHEAHLTVHQWDCHLSAEKNCHLSLNDSSVTTEVDSLLHYLLYEVEG